MDHDYCCHIGRFLVQQLPDPLPPKLEPHHLASARGAGSVTTAAAAVKAAAAAKKRERRRANRASVGEQDDEDSDSEDGDSDSDNGGDGDDDSDDSDDDTVLGALLPLLPEGAPIWTAPLPVVNIISTEKVAGGATSKGYVNYVIRAGRWESKHRYSEFESLRSSFQRLHPSIVLPPLPEKHSFTQMVITNKGKENEEKLIEKRMRMLQTFLNKIAQHSVLCREHLFHRFLEPGINWNEVLSSPLVTSWPRNILAMPPSTSRRTINADGTIVPSISPNSAIPMPATTQPLRNPDPRWIECEIFTAKYKAQMSEEVEVTSKAITKKLNELSSDYQELGALLNGFSLMEPEEMGPALERIGQAADMAYISTNLLSSSLEANVNERLQEYSQYSDAISSALRYRHLKHLQAELTSEMVLSKRTKLTSLEAADEESRNLERALRGEAGLASAGSASTVIDPDSVPIRFAPTVSSVNDSSRIGVGDEYDHEQRYSNTHNMAATTPNIRHIQHDGNRQLASSEMVSNQQQQLNSTPGGSVSVGLFGRLSHAVQGLMDVDNTANRRGTIGKQRDEIIGMEEQLNDIMADLNTINNDVQNDLDRFQREKVRDIRDVLVGFAEAQAEWCRKNAQAWKDSLAEVNDI